MNIITGKPTPPPMARALLQWSFLVPRRFVGSDPLRKSNILDFLTVTAGIIDGEIGVARLTAYTTLSMFGGQALHLVVKRSVADIAGDFFLQFALDSSAILARMGSESGLSLPNNFTPEIVAHMVRMGGKGRIEPTPGEISEMLQVIAPVCKLAGIVISPSHEHTNQTPEQTVH